MEKYDAKSTAKVILPDGKWDGGLVSEKKVHVPFNDFRYKFEIDRIMKYSNHPCEVEVIQSFAYIRLKKKNAG